MAKLSKLQQEALTILEHNVNFQRGINTAETHATEAGVDIKTSAFIDHVKEHKDEINSLIGEVIPANRSKKPQVAATYASGTASTPSESNPIELHEQNVDVSDWIKDAKPSKTVVPGIKGVQATRFSVSLGASRKDVWLEPEFVTALYDIAPDKEKRAEWLRNRALAASQQNPASAIRCAIVTELLGRVPS
jgi:hypothetical protein